MYILADCSIADADAVKHSTCFKRLPPLSTMLFPQALKASAQTLIFLHQQRISTRWMILIFSIPVLRHIRSYAVSPLRGSFHRQCYSAVVYSMYTFPSCQRCLSSFCFFKISVFCSGFCSFSLFAGHYIAVNLIHLFPVFFFAMA